MKTSTATFSALVALTMLTSAAHAQPSEATLASCREQAVASMKDKYATSANGQRTAATEQKSESGRHDPAEQALVDQCVKNGGRL